jgi:hypothetical protein
VFGLNPIPFQSHIVNWAQNELLDMFAKVDLRQFMKAYSSMAIQSIKSGTEYFQHFGISILDIQVHRNRRPCTAAHHHLIRRSSTTSAKTHAPKSF